MPKEQKRELMIEWFHANYEDPAERLPYETAEGGYQWIWGGPYGAEEEIRETFEGLVSDLLIREVVDEVQSDGLLEWAPTPRRDDYDDNDRLEELDPLDALPDELGRLFGSAAEMAARQKAIEALRGLERTLREPRTPGIGHNQPPDEIDDAETGAQIDVGSAAKELSEELEKATPSVIAAKRLLRCLRGGIAIAGRWLGRKVDVAVDETIKTAVRVAFLAPVLASDAKIQAAVQAAYDLAVRWLHLATQPF